MRREDCEESRIAEMKKGLCCTWVQREAIENNTKILAHLDSSVGAHMSQFDRLTRLVQIQILHFGLTSLLQMLLRSESWELLII